MIDESMRSNVKEFLVKNKLAYLATLSSQTKTPQVAAVYYYYDNKNHIVFSTTQESRKIANIMQDASVAFCIGRDDTKETLQIEGQARIIEDREERLQLLTLLYKKISENETRSFHWPIIKLHTKDVIVIKVAIDWFRYGSFGEKTSIIEGTGENLL